jgi:hypothetical protein
MLTWFCSLVDAPGKTSAAIAIDSWPWFSDWPGAIWDSRPGSLVHVTTVVPAHRQRAASTWPFW